MSQSDAIEAKKELVEAGFHNVRIYKNRRKGDDSVHDTHYVTASVRPNKNLYFEYYIEIEAAIFSAKEKAKV